MTIKKDGSGKRWVEMEFVTPGTPEQVWHAMATSAGNAAWFTKATIDERVGGTLRFHFGPDVTTSGEVTEWQPPHRFGYVEREWQEGAPPIATEITITSRAGGQCVVRMVHSLFASTDDWDDQMEGFERGWPAFFDILRLYLAHFAGQPGASARAMKSVRGSALEIWSQLLSKLALSGADVGERRGTPAQPQALSGVVERIQQDAKMRSIMLRLDTPSPGVALFGTYDAGDSINASVTIFYYGADAEHIAQGSEPKWNEWLEQTFAARA